MKRILIIFFACSTLLACNKMEDNSPKLITITGGIKLNDTKAQPVASELNGNSTTVHFDWEEGDVVTIIVPTTQPNPPIIRTFSVINSTINTENHTASFIGEAFDMSNGYTVVAGATLNMESQGFMPQTTYVENSYKACGMCMGTGTSSGFTIDKLFPVLKLQLKGNVLIKKIKVCTKSDAPSQVTFGLLDCVEGIQLSNEPKTVYFPIINGGAAVWRIIFYGDNDAIIMEKESNFDLTSYSGFINKIISFPELTVEQQQ